MKCFVCEKEDNTLSHLITIEPMNRLQNWLEKLKGFGDSRGSNIENQLKSIYLRERMVLKIELQ